MEIYFSIIVFVFGLVIGSFLNCLIWRLHENESLAGRSYCPHCRKTIAWYDNIPLLSFMSLGGRCRLCRSEISWQYPAVELATAVFFLFAWQASLSSADLFLALLRDWLLIATLVIIFVFDLRWQLVPMLVVWPMAGVIAVINLFLGYPWDALIFFGAIGAAFFLVQYVVTARRGVGEGDIWIGALLGLAFPDPAHLLLIMIVSYSVGAIVGVTLISIRKKGWQSHIALGPFLVAGALVALFWGQRLIDWYLAML